MGWAGRLRRLKVRTNADTPPDAEQAMAFGAEGIGLCRTEHMFFAEDRIAAMREMIVSRRLSREKSACQASADAEGRLQKGIYKAMKGNPVTIRFLDPPLHGSCLRLRLTSKRLQR